MATGDVGRSVRERFWLLVDGGLSIREASVGAGVCQATGIKWVKRAGLARLGYTVGKTDRVVVVCPEGATPSQVAKAQGMFDRDDQQDQVVDLVGQGSTVKEAAQQVGVSESAARRWSDNAGVLVVRRYSDVVRHRFWAVWDQCHDTSVAAREVGVHPATGRRWVRAAGGGRGPGRPIKSGSVSPLSGGLGWHDRSVFVDVDAKPGYRLSVREREQIAWGLSQKWSIRKIAAEMGRSASTVSREVTRNSGVDGQYRLLTAEQKAQTRAKRPKEAKLVADTPLRRYVAAGLKQKRSPEQIAHRIRLDYPDDPEMRVCHETIYQAIYVEARGGLKRDVERCLRQGRAYRQPRRKTGERRGRIPGMVPIADRPDISDRLVPGHWEGDLIIGKNNASAVGTVVERCFRYTMLAHLDGDHTAPTVRDAIVGLLGGMPGQLCRSLTWDQGREMACHFEVAQQADIEVYFADPHSPWQRGTNENTNGLLRQYLPKGTDLSLYTPHDLQAIADELNNRPRKVLGWLTPTEALHLYLGHTVIIGGRPAHLPDNLQPLAQRCVDQ